VDIGGRFGVGIVISGLAEVTVIKRMKIQGVGLSFKKVFKLRPLPFLMLKTAIYPTYIIHNNIKKLENQYIICIFERKSSLQSGSRSISTSSVSQLVIPPPGFRT
jgi:hypothetical protein